MIKVKALLRLLVVFLTTVCFFRSAPARVFVLPGLYYSDDFGWVLTGSLIAQNESGARLQTSVEYFGGDDGSVQISWMLPRDISEWTFLLKMQSFLQEIHSQEHPSNQDAVFLNPIKSFEFIGRRDFFEEKGLFFGYQGSFKSFSYTDETWRILPECPGWTESALIVSGLEYALSLRAGLESRDHRYYSREGVYLLWQCDLGFAHSRGEQDELVRVQTDLREYVPIRPTRSVLAFNVRGGAIHHQVPYFSQFKMGGYATLRGFPLDRYNGNGYYSARIEIRQDLAERVEIPLGSVLRKILNIERFQFTPGFVLFGDGGDLWRPDLGWWGFRQGVGAGLRIYVPPGVVGACDIAKPADSGYYTLYISLEQSF